MLRDALVTRLVFQPTPGVDLVPERVGIDAAEVWIESGDGVRIHAFHVPDAAATSAAARSSRAILFLHGNAGNASHRLPNAALLAALGADVLLLDYRGYGRSEGTPSEAGVYADARAGLDHLLRERGFDVSRVVVFGRSLGGAIAVELAQERPLAGVILESTFTSLADMGARLLGAPGRWLAGPGFDSARRIDALRSPLLFFHGDRDEIVPHELGRRLFERAPSPRAFETIVGAGHNDTVEVGGRAYFERIGRFLDEVAPRPAT
jgi:fermentation-respiration switch protein FrsA (DUF1100 family)